MPLSINICYKKIFSAMDYGDFSTLVFCRYSKLFKEMLIYSELFLFSFTVHLVFNCICLVFVLLTNAF